MTFLLLVAHFLAGFSGLAFGGESSSPPPLYIEEETDPEFNLELPLTFAEVHNAVTVRFDEQADGSCYELQVRQGTLSLARISGEQPTWLVEGASFEVAEDGSALITLRRRAESISLLVGGRLVTKAWTEEGVGGRLTVYASAGLLDPDNVYYQPYAPPEFADDFMRGGTESTGEWQVLLGTWENTALVESLEFVPTAANSFAFAAHPQPLAMATTGPAFWDDIRATVSVRLMEAGRVGLGCRVQDEASYYAFMLDLGVPEAGGQALLMLVKVVGGEEHCLASTRRSLAMGQWYNLGLATEGNRLEAYLDEAPVLTATDNAYAQGQIALVAQNCETAYFDDAKVEGYRGFFEDFESNGHSRWQTVSGQWQTAKDTTGKYLAKVSPEVALAIAGRSEWSDYEVHADFLAGKEAVGLCLAWQGTDNYLLWRCTRSKQELIRISAEGEQTLDTGPLQLPSHSWATVVARLRPDYVSVSVNDQRPVEALLPVAPFGKIGLWAGPGGPVAFDNIKVSFPRGYVPALLPETMATDAEMKEQFANPAEGWFSITDETHKPTAVGMNWNKGEYFDPVDVTFPLANVIAGAGKVTVTIEGDQTGSAEGYQLTLTTQANSPKLTLELFRSGQPLTQGEVEVGESGTCQVRFGRRGTFVVVYVDDVLVLTYREPFSLATLEAKEAVERAQS
ncbi:MAG: hypothetical protein ACUVX8_01865 [Candidatus Zipacnadales bacterium]